jgi:hypothetical protein
MTRLDYVILRLYPRSWRARYEDEMAATLGDCKPTLMTRFDLLLGAIDAWSQLNYSARSQRTMDTSQSRFVLRSCVMIAVIAQAAELAYALQYVFPNEILNNTDWIWLIGDGLTCTLIGAYLATRRRRLPAATGAGAVVGVCTSVMLMGMEFAGFVANTRLHPIVGYGPTWSMPVLALPWLETSLIPLAVSACAGAALGTAGWAAFKYAPWRPLAEAFAVLLGNLAAASQASAKALAHAAQTTELLTKA